ncbi:MAG: hypothetical protein Q9227_008634 [Pyrenula ochraceoflavens]
MNWLHDRYRKAGRINDDDMLHTLGLFALELMRWTRNLEWRDLGDLERGAMAVYWKNMGEGMSISWQNGLEWLRELEAWSQSYELDNMIPSPSNKTLALATVDVGLMNVPKMLKPMGLQFAAALLDRRLRRAMMFEEPPQWVQKTLRLAIGLRKLILRNLFLPRPEFMRVQWFTPAADDFTGKYHFMQYIGHPWYIKPTLSRRWNFNSWLLWLTGGFVPSEKRREYRPEGYAISDLGPVALEGKGREEMDAAKNTIRRIQGCPFHQSQKTVKERESCIVVGCVNYVV